MRDMYEYEDGSRFLLSTKPTLPKNEYLALELTRCWAVGLQNRGCLHISDILENYDKALKHLNNKENNNE